MPFALVVGAPLPTCKAKDANGVTPRQPVAKYAEEGGLLGSLPTELTLTVALLLLCSRSRSLRWARAAQAAPPDRVLRGSIWSARSASRRRGRRRCRRTPRPRRKILSETRARASQCGRRRWSRRGGARRSGRRRRCRSSAARARARARGGVRHVPRRLPRAHRARPAGAPALARVDAHPRPRAPRAIDDAVLLHADRDARRRRRPPLRAVVRLARAARARCGCGTCARASCSAASPRTRAASSAPRSARSPTSSPPPTRAAAVCSGTSTTRAVRRRAPPPSDAAASPAAAPAAARARRRRRRRPRRRRRR